LEKNNNSNIYKKTQYGTMYLGDAIDVLKENIKNESVDLIVTSPPFGLIRKKEYGDCSHD